MARRKRPQTLRRRLSDLVGSTAGAWLLRGLGLALLLLVAGLVVRQARARAWRLPAYRLGPASVRYVGLPAAFGPTLRKTLLDPRRLAFDVSVFDARAEDVIRGVVSRHPLVAGVDGVEIRYPDRVDLRVRVREPAAFFEVRRRDGRRGFVMVSWDGRVLAPEPYAHYRRMLRVPLPRVYGVRADPPRLYGQAWEDRPEQVAEGISAARVAAKLYRDFNGTLIVRAIDVSAFPASPDRRRQGEVRLHLHDDTVVEWGRTERDLEGVAGEDSYEVKRWRLERELARHTGARRRKIDVRFRLPGEGDLAHGMR